MGIDHVAVARALLGETQGKTAEEALVFAVCAVADATLALVEQQRIANLIALSQYTTPLGDMPVYRPCIWEGGDLREDVRKGLGL